MRIYFIVLSPAFEKGNDGLSAAECLLQDAEQSQLLLKLKSAYHRRHLAFCRVVSLLGPEGRRGGRN